VYETEPVGGPAQDPYLNAVALVAPVPPARLLAAARGAEQEAGRVRDVRWGPRTLDVDVIHVPGVVSDDPELTLPHPRAHERAFVLAPWLDLDPGATLPGYGRAADLLKGIGTPGIRRLDDLVLP
jgi:2-amino-4-hydroxy-6-hydroxymethyldihydropteridine diphosphokinase